MIVEQIESCTANRRVRRLAAASRAARPAIPDSPSLPIQRSERAVWDVIPREAKGARDTVLNLADIFRYFLETRKTYLPLEQELSIIKAYLEIEQLRLGPKLRIEIDVAAEALTAPIPVLSIQPLVENAVKHGIAPRPDGGLVRIEARRDASGVLAIRVRDTGGGFAKPGTGGIGLENVSRRLELCYGPEARLEIQSGVDGTEVSFQIPATAMPQTQIVAATT